MAACIGLVKKDIHDQNKRKAEEWKEEKRGLSFTCYSDYSVHKRHMEEKHGNVRLKATDKTGFDIKMSSLQEMNTILKDNANDENNGFD